MKILKTAIAISMVNAITMAAIITLTAKPVRPTTAIPSSGGQTDFTEIQRTSSPASPIPPSTIPSPALKKSPIPTLKPSPTVDSPIQASPVSAPASPQPTATTPTPTPTPDNRCLIQIDGATYDITQFRYQHSGGNIFQCGTDMSAVFWSRHGQQQLNYLQRFRI